MTNPSKLEEIAGRVLRESALEVYIQACGRARELNDVCFEGGFHSKDMNYVRAVHNVSEDKLVFYSLDSLESYLYPTIRELEARAKPFDSLNIVAYGPIRYTERKGLIFKKEVEKTAPLSDFVKNGGSRNAYFMKFVINADIRDSAYRNSPNFPVLTIVAPEQVVRQIVDYLRQNPGQYESIVRAILPKSMFPKVNAGILDKMKATGRLVLLDTEKVPRDSQESMAEKVRKYGEQYTIKPLITA